MKRIKRIKTISQFMRWVSKQPIDVHQGPYIYRGLRDATWTPKSSIHREISQDGEDPDKRATYRQKVDSLLVGAKERQFDLTTTRHILSDLQLMAELQHNHARTMLIDFSGNPLVALWFACTQNRDSAQKRRTPIHGKILSIDTAQLSFKEVSAIKLRNMTLDECMQLSTNVQEGVSGGTQKNKAKWHIWRGRHLTARTQAQDSFFIFSWPEHPDALLDVGATLLIDSDSKPAMAYQLEKYFGIEASKLFPDRHGYARWHQVPTPSARRALDHGVKLLKIREQNAQAIAYLDTAIALDPELAEAYFHRGRAKYYQKRFRAALPDYDRAIALDERDVSAYIARGEIHWRLRHYELAIFSFNQALEIDPNSSRAYHARGYVTSFMGESEAAILDFNRAITLDPNFAIAYIARSDAYRKIKNYEAALLDAEQAIAITPNNPDMHVTCGVAKICLRHYQGAVADYTTAIDLRPDYAEAYRQRAIAFRLLGDRDVAQADLAKAKVLANAQQSDA